MEMDNNKLRYEIVNDIAERHIVEDIVNKVGRGENEDNLKDLSQDVYLSLMLNYPIEKLKSAYMENTLNYVVARIVCNQILSKTSKYHYTYRKTFNGQQLTDAIISKLLTDE